LLKIPHVVVAINKMDLVNYAEDVYNNIVIDYSKVAQQIGLKNVTFIPISAAKGDNIVAASNALSWYTGEPLLSFLEKVQLENDINLSQARFPVQYVIRPQTEDLHDYRGYAGRINSGIYKQGDKVLVLPSGIETTIRGIEVGGKKVAEAFAPQSAIIHLAHDIDVSRGDMIVQSNDLPVQSNELELLMCWMDTRPLVAGGRYLLQLNNKITRAIVKSIQYKLDVNTLEQLGAPGKVGLNDIVKVNVKTASPVLYDTYASLRSSGSAILIDETSNVTVGACMIV
jgi:sulfate adenylyltransferase subunit 1